jgi:hypothetical protein
MTGKLALAGLMAVAAWAAQPMVLVDEVFDIAPGKAGAVPIDLRQQAAGMKCFYEVKDGADVQPMIISEAGENLYQGEFSAGGEFSYRIHKPGSYKVLFNNSRQMSGVSHVYVKIMLDFFDGKVITAAPERQKLAIFGTLGLFVIFTGFAARKLVPAIAERKTQPPPSMYL